MFASLFGRTQIVNKLIKKGASVKSKDLDGRTAISIAEKQYNKEMIKILKK